MNQEQTSFTSLNLSEDLYQSLSKQGFHSPTDIQAKTIPLLLDGRDVIGLAQTGTGKTAAFALPILEKLKRQDHYTQALILAPTRELAIQVSDQIEKLSAYNPITIATLCGGQDYKKQLTQLKKGAQIVVGTPGRILDHIERKSLKLAQLKTFVLDEADEMLRMGFIEDVERILSELPKQKQVALFSATMPKRVHQIAKTYLSDPTTIEIKQKTATVEAIEQQFLFASFPQKPSALLRILAVSNYQSVIIFVRTKSNTEEVSEFLQKYGHRSMAIHGDINQSIRERIISQFRSGAIKILVATDVAARGLDVEHVSHVINYDIPFDCETYVHRIGRTGRAGRSGKTILFVTPKESRLLGAIEKHTRQRIQKINIPSDKDIQQAKEEKFEATINERLQHEQLKSYENIIEKFLEKSKETPEKIAAALALMLHNDKPWHEQSSMPKIANGPKETSNRDKRKPSKKPKRSQSFEYEGFQSNGARDKVLFRLDVGHIHGVKPGNIVGAIANEGGLQSKHITGLKIRDDHSTVMLPKDLPKTTVNDLIKTRVCGRKLNLHLVK